MAQLVNLPEPVTFNQCADSADHQRGDDEARILGTGRLPRRIARRMTSA
jgi:hypothetical protein